MLQPAHGIRKKRFRNQVFAKITDEQFDWLSKSAEREDKNPSEFIRDLIQAAMDRQGGDDIQSVLAEILNGQALLQCVRTELLTIGASLTRQNPTDLQNLKAKSEQVAISDLVSFKGRMLDQLRFKVSLTPEKK